MVMRNARAKVSETQMDTSPSIIIIIIIIVIIMSLRLSGTSYDMLNRRLFCSIFQYLNFVQLPILDMLCA